MTPHRQRDRDSWNMPENPTECTGSLIELAQRMQGVGSGNTPQIDREFSGGFLDFLTEKTGRFPCKNRCVLAGPCRRFCTGFSALFLEELSTFARRIPGLLPEKSWRTRPKICQTFKAQILRHTFQMESRVDSKNKKSTQKVPYKNP